MTPLAGSSATSMRTALNSSAARSAGASACGTTSANGSITLGTVAASRAATLVGDIACQGSGAGMSSAVSTSTATRFAEHPLFRRRGQTAHNLIAHTPKKWQTLRTGSVGGSPPRPPELRSVAKTSDSSPEHGPENLDARRPGWNAALYAVWAGQLLALIGFSSRVPFLHWKQVRSTC